MIVKIIALGMVKETLPLGNKLCVIFLSDVCFMKDGIDKISYGDKNIVFSKILKAKGPNEPSRTSCVLSGNS